MPELPEVETTLRGVKPHLIQQAVSDIIIRHPRLRWPIPANLKALLQGKIIREVSRRAKYLLLQFDHGTLIIHLGMSGRLSLVTQAKSAQKHDHVDIILANQLCLRFTDPRRFGAVLWTQGTYDEHSLLKHIGPEPLEKEFNAAYLFARSRGRQVAVKLFIMDSKVVAGVGNIYATEALFDAQIRPQKPAGKVTEAEYERLVAAIKKVLRHAIKKGGTTLKDFAHPTGSPGYFSIALKAYGHAGKPCPRCNTKLKNIRLGQRATVYCPHCQP